MALIVTSAGSSVQSVLFSGTLGTDVIDYDRMTSDRTAAGANIGSSSSDGTIEIWIRPTSANNNTGSAWVNGNIFIDNDMVEGDNSPVGGQYGLSVCNNTVRLGVATQTNTTYTEYIATSTVNDDAWHFIVFTWDASTGDIQLYVDTDREATGTHTGGAGNLGWVSGGNTKAQLNEFAGEKNDFESGDSLSFFGRISQIRFSDTVRYTAATLTVPTSAMTADGDTIGLWNFTEGSGTSIADSSTNSNTMSIVTGGDPTVPTWSGDGPY